MGVVMELLKKVTQHKCQSSHYQVIRDEGSPQGLPGTGRSATAPQLRAVAPRCQDGSATAAPGTRGVPSAPTPRAPRPGQLRGPCVPPAAAGARRGTQSVAALGWVMSAGTTQASNSASVTKPSSRADWRRDSPLWCAFLAILEALS